MNAALSVGGEPMSEPEAEAPSEDEGPGPLACKAFWKGLQAGDHAAAFEAFKELLMAADDELSVDVPDEPAPTPV